MRGVFVIIDTNLGVLFAFRYAKLHPSLQSIIEFLYTHNGVFEGSFSDMTRQLGRKATVSQKGKVIVYGEESNVRKYVLQLEAMGIVQVSRWGNRINGVRLLSDWTLKI